MNAPVDSENASQVDGDDGSKSLVVEKIACKPQNAEMSFAKRIAVHGIAFIRSKLYKFEQRINPNQEAQRVLGREVDGELNEGYRAALDVRVAKAEIRGAFYTLVTCILTAFGLVPLWLAYEQWKDEIDSRRNEQSLRYVERMLEEPIYSASFQAGQLLAAAGAQSNTDIIPFAEAYILGSSRSIKTLLVFYESMASCVEKNLCNGDVLAPFIDTSDKLIFRASCPYINRLREAGDTKFALATEGFLNISCADIEASTAL